MLTSSYCTCRGLLEGFPQMSCDVAAALCSTIGAILVSVSLPGVACVRGTREWDVLVHRSTQVEPSAFTPVGSCSDIYDIVCGWVLEVAQLVQQSSRDGVKTGSSSSHTQDLYLFPLTVLCIPHCPLYPSLSPLPLTVPSTPHCPLYPSLFPLPLTVPCTPHCPLYPSQSPAPLTVPSTPHCPLYPSLSPALLTIVVALLSSVATIIRCMAEDVLTFKNMILKFLLSSSQTVLESMRCVCVCVVWVGVSVMYVGGCVCDVGGCVSSHSLCSCSKVMRCLIQGDSPSANGLVMDALTEAYHFHLTENSVKCILFACIP